MSLGFVLFDDPKIALTLSIIPGILSVLVLYRISKIFVNNLWALITCTIFYTLPVIIWLSKSDAKVDLALLYVLLAIVLLILEHFFNKESDSEEQESLSFFKDPDTSLWFLVGWLTGFAMSIKYTAFIAGVSLVVFIFYLYSGKWNALAAFFFCFAFIFGFGLYRFSNLDISSHNSFWLIALPAAIGLICTVIATLKQRAGTIRGIWLTSIFGISCFCLLIPWGIKNISEHGKVSIGHFLTGQSNLPKIDFRINRWDRSSTLEGKSIFKLASMDDDFFSWRNATGKDEEISRYLGYESGVIQFLSLPYDITTKRNVHTVIMDVSMLFLIFLPLLSLTPDKESFSLEHPEDNNMERTPNYVDYVNYKWGWGF